MPYHPPLDPKVIEALVLWRKRVGSIIQARREELNLSQAVLAEKAGYSTKYMGEIETGIASPSIDALVAIAKTLNLKLPNPFVP